MEKGLDIYSHRVIVHESLKKPQRLLKRGPCAKIHIFFLFFFLNLFGKKELFHNVWETIYSDNWFTAKMIFSNCCPWKHLMPMVTLEKGFNPYPTTIFVQKMSAFMSAVHIQVQVRLDFFMQANNMNPDHTAPKGAV